MRKYLVGAVIGAIVATAVQAFAVSNQITVNTRLINFLFNGQNQVTEAIEYQDHLYVPVRFVAENMGISVDWNGQSSTVSFRSGQAVPAKPIPDEKKPAKADIPMPSVTNNNVTVSLTQESVRDNQTILGIQITNTGSVPVRISGIAAQKVGEQGPVNFGMSLDSSTGLIDQTLLNNIQPGSSLSGNISVPSPIDGLTTSLTLDIKIKHGEASDADSFQIAVPVQK